LHFYRVLAQTILQTHNAVILLKQTNHISENNFLERHLHCHKHADTKLAKAENLVKAELFTNAAQLLSIYEFSYEPVIFHTLSIAKGEKYKTVFLNHCYGFYVE
jgi:hypothetical protein